MLFCLTVLHSVTLYRTVLPSVLWRCWLGIRKSIQPLKIEWRGVGEVICLERGADSRCTRHVANFTVRVSSNFLPYLRDCSASLGMWHMQTLNRITIGSRVIGVSLRPPSHWRRLCGRPRTSWQRAIDTDVQSVNIGVQRWPHALTTYRRQGNTQSWGMPLKKVVVVVVCIVLYLPGLCLGLSICTNPAFMLPKKITIDW